MHNKSTTETPWEGNAHQISFVLWRTVSLPDDSQRKAGENPGLKLERETMLTKDELSHFV